MSHVVLEVDAADGFGVTFDGPLERCKVVVLEVGSDDAAHKRVGFLIEALLRVQCQSQLADLNRGICY